MNKQGIKKLVLVLGLTMIGMVSAHAQQSIQFTQYIFNSLSINPAYAGYKEEWFAQMGLRSQWSGIDGAPKTGQLSVDGILDPQHKRMGFGVQVTADKLGPQSATSAYLNYAYRLRLDAEDTKRLSFGLGLGATQYGLDGTMINTVDGSDQAFPVGNISNIVPDVRFGIYYYTPKWYLGASVLDLFSGDSSNDLFRWQDNGTQNIRRKRHLYLTTGMLFDLSEDTRLRPSIMMSEDFKGPTTLDLSVMSIFSERIWFGAAYRTGVTLWNKEFRDGQKLSSTNSISGIAQFYISDRFRLGYSYDHTLNELGSMQNGSHELTLGLTFRGKTKRMVSPRFF